MYQSPSFSLRWILGASFASRCHGVSFSDPQCGKGPSDRTAASLKSHMRVHLNQGSKIRDSPGNSRRYPVIRECSRSRCYIMRLIAKPKPLFECEDRRREFEFQCSKERRKPDGLGGAYGIGPLRRWYRFQIL